MSVLSKVGKLNERIAKVMIVIAGIVTILMGALTLADVAGRYLFNHPVPVAVEIGTEIIVALTFMCLPYVQLQRRQIHVDFLIERASSKTKHILGIVTEIVVFGIGLIWSYSSVKLAVNSWRSGAVTPGVYPVPYTPSRVIMAFGLVVFTICVLLQILQRFSKSGSQPHPKNDMVPE